MTRGFLLVAILFLLFPPGLAKPGEREPEPSFESVLAEIERLRFAFLEEEAKLLAKPLLGRAVAEFGDDSGEAARAKVAYAQVLLGPGTREERRRLIEEALATLERIHGPDSIELAPALQALAGITRETDLEAAQPVYRRLVSIWEREVRDREQRLGFTDLEVASALEKLEYQMLLAEEKSGRLSVLRRALGIRESISGPRDPSLIPALTALGALFADLGEFKEARANFDRALQLWDSVPRSEGKVSPSDARQFEIICSELGKILDLRGEFAESRVLRERALAYDSSAFGPESPRAARVINDLASTFEDMGDPAEAARLFERRNRIMAQNKRIQAMPFGLTNLARVLREMGRYAEARSALEEAVILTDLQFPAEVQALPRLALADLLAETGDFIEAQRLYERCLDDVRRSSNDVLLRYRGAQQTEGEILSSLGRLSLKAGDSSRALDFDRQALTIDEKAEGPEGLTVASDLDALGEVLSATGRYAEAEPQFERALAIQEKVLGPDHPNVAVSLAGLAALQAATGDYAEGIRRIDRALKIRESVYGPEHPLVGSDLKILAFLRMGAGDAAGALAAALRAESIGRASLRLTAHTLGERQALRYASARVSGLDLALTLAARASGPGPARPAWDALIRSRALVLDEMASRNRDREAVADPELRRLVDSLAKARTRLANLTMRGLQPATSEDHRQRLDQTRGEMESVERELAVKSASYRQERAEANIGLAQVAAAVPSGSALVGYALYQDTGSAAGPPLPSYLAFVLDAHSGQPFSVPLGPAGEIDRLVTQMKRATTEGMFPGNPPAIAESEYRLAGEALRKRIWDPVSSRLASARRVFVVPDGVLNLVPLASLPVGRSAYLLEKGPVIHYLSSERDLVSSAPPAKRGAGLLALGNADFEGRPLSVSPAGEAGVSPRSPRASGAGSPPFRGRRSACGDFTTLKFEPLPGTEREVEEVVRLYASRSAKTRSSSSPPLLLTGERASESAFKEGAPGHRILHLATHGFFLGGRCQSALDSTRGIGGLKGDLPPETLPLFDGENPLLLSGLALAGANDRGAAGPEEDDGILTAEEIGALDLSGTEWAVLSACDTGTGTFQAGEGVLGLRRAFEVAGVRTVIMSLWAVEDESAREWMKALYEGRLVKRLDTAEAVRHASLAVLAARRARGESTHPFYWAGFVAAGDWR